MSSGTPSGASLTSRSKSASLSSVISSILGRGGASGSARLRSLLRDAAPGARRALVRREVEALDVLRRHPPRAEGWPELGDRLPHEGDPALRQARLVALVIRREHLLGEHGVERFRFRFVLLCLSRTFRTLDREPDRGGVRLGPPAVE